MAWLREWVWRIAVFLLPWQVRWFTEGERIGGWPWEPGRLSLYLSWMPLIATVFLAITITPSIPLIRGKSDKPPLTRGGREGFWIGIALLIFATLFTLSAAATVQFWMQFGLLIAFVWAVHRLDVSREALASSFVLSLVPHAAWGVAEFAVQYVPGSKWLGMAFQHPRFSGVSVIEHDGLRLLRAYGGFPHPNIFGGWLAVAIPLGVWLADRLRRRSAAYAMIFTAALLTCALVLTFSRSAWVGFVVGLLVVSVVLIRQPSVNRYGWLALIAVLMAGAAVAVSQWDHIIARTGTEARLEARSVDERTQSLREGVAVFRAHPFLGVGPGAIQKATDSSIPPHNVYLLILAEVGLVGVVGLLMLAFSVRSYFLLPTHYFLVPIAIIALFDHYLWSLWPGRALLVLALAFFLLPQRQQRQPA